MNSSNQYQTAEVMNELINDPLIEIFLVDCAVPGQPGDGCQQ
jgi:hypothetical protein